MVGTEAGSTTGVSAEVADQNDGKSAPDFADLLDTYDYRQPRRGQVLEGVVLKAGEEVIVDVGVKRDAFVPRKDLDRLDDGTLDSLEPGAEVMVYVLRPRSTDGDLIVSINKALEQEDWLRAEKLLHEGGVVEAEVVGANKGGLLVEFGRLRGFVPQSHVTSTRRNISDEELYEAKSNLAGQTLSLKVIEVNRRRSRLVMSERAARREARRARMAALEEGQVLTGRVVSLKDYGAFVDIGDIDGLIHISELAWQRVGHPGEVLSVGDEVEVLVKGVDLERERVSLSRKALLRSPWDTVEEDYRVGDVATGTVTNVVDFGAFVGLPSGVEGLVHVGQMSTYGISHPRDLVRRGDEVLVRVMGIDPGRERVSLSLDAVTSAEYLEWMETRSEVELDSASSDADELQN